MRHALPRKQTMAKKIRELEERIRELEVDFADQEKELARHYHRAESAEEALKVYQEAESIWRSRVAKAEQDWRKRVAELEAELAEWKAHGAELDGTCVSVKARAEKAETLARQRGDERDRINADWKALSKRFNEAEARVAELERRYSDARVQAFVTQLEARDSKG